MSTPAHNVRSLLLLQPREGNFEALLEFFRDQDILGKAVEHAGALAAEVHVPLSRSGPVVVTATWESAAAYDGWLNHPIRATLGPGLEALVEPGDPSPITSGLYEIALAVPSPPHSPRSVSRP